MTKKETDRAEVFIRINQKKTTQSKAAIELNLSLRHLQRLYKLFKEQGLIALTSKKRGKTSNHQLPEILKVRVKELVTCELYNGFRPTFMCEKLEEKHDIKISVETTRQLMIQSGVWRSKKEKRPVVHQQRQRRARYGELVQIDGSPHAWFEDRRKPCVLLVFIDDATGRTFGRFFESETTFGYMITIREYIAKFGRPIALYSDRHGIFRVNKPGCVRKENLTQFGRALKELNIDLLCANSPQAKGRVERVNQTLQDRLIKEMRLANISTIEEGNLFLEAYWIKFNQQYAITPTEKENAHRKSELNLDKILCEKHERKVSKNLEIQFENKIYQIPMIKPSKEIIRARITVLKGLDGSISLEYKGLLLPCKEFSKQISNAHVVSSKEIDYHFNKPKGRKPAKHHPWLQEKRAEIRKELYLNA